jgi:hypothetical protein
MVALKNRREHFECKAHGTQRPRHIIKIGAEASTAQRSEQEGGGKAAGNTPAYSLRVNRIAQQVCTGGQYG